MRIFLSRDIYLYESFIYLLSRNEEVENVVFLDFLGLFIVTYMYILFLDFITIYVPQKQECIIIIVLFLYASQFMPTFKK